MNSLLAHSHQIALVVTALPHEAEAIVERLEGVEWESNEAGAQYRVGGYRGGWRVAVAEIGMGNATAAAATAHAINHFRPDVALFVGVAGGIKDVEIGSVVAATDVFGFERGKDDQQGFKPRAAIARSDHRLVQAARRVCAEDQWVRQPGLEGASAAVGPIIAGEKVLASTASDLFDFVARNYSQALAVGMEGLGFLEATFQSSRPDAIVIRGISDLLKGKSEADANGSQETAARHAAAFAFSVLNCVATPPSTGLGPGEHADFPHLPIGSPTDNLSFTSRSLDMAGRAEDLARVRDFCDSPEEFAWWVIVGEAGVGKSRLAYEACLTLGAEWSVGFVRDADQEALLQFVPTLPTLLVVDYAAARSEWLSRCLLHFSELSTLPAPLRILVIERSEHTPWYETVTRQHIYHESVKILSCRYAEPMALAGLDPAGIESLVAQGLAQTGSGQPEPTVIDDLVDRTYELDPSGRPLFAAVALLEALEPTVTGSSRDAVLRSLIDRRRAQSPAGIAATLPYQVGELIATMLGGLDLTLFERIREVAPQGGQLPPLESIDQNLLGEMLKGLTPDILGELHVLDCLGGTGVVAEAASVAKRNSWIADRQRYAAFVGRYARDHMAHPALLSLLEVDHSADNGENLRSWYELATELLPYLGPVESGRPQAVIEMIRQTESALEKDHVVADARFALANLWLAEGSLNEAEAIYNDVIATAPPESNARWGCLTNRGIIRMQQGQLDLAMRDWTAVIDDFDATDESRACCLNNRADLHVDAGDHKRAIEDRTTVLELEETTYNRRFIALVRRAASYWALDDDELANADVDHILGTADIAAEQKMSARLERAKRLIASKDVDAALGDLDAVILSRRHFPGQLREALSIAEALGAGATEASESVNPTKPRSQRWFSRNRGPT